MKNKISCLLLLAFCFICYTACENESRNDGKNDSEVNGSEKQEAAGVKGWNVLDTGDHGKLNVLFGNSSSEVYAGGDNSTVLHYDGDKWIQYDKFEYGDVHSILAFNPTNLYAGMNTPDIFYYNEGQWTQADIGYFTSWAGDVQLSALLPATTNNQVDFMVSISDYSTPYGYPDYIWVYDSNVYRYAPDSDSTTRLFRRSYWCTAIVGFPTGEKYVGCPNNIHYYDGHSWKQTNIETPENKGYTNSICAISKKQIILYFHNSNPVVHYNDGKYSVLLVPGENIHISDMWSLSEDEIYAVGYGSGSKGDAGIIWKYDGSQWVEVYRTTNMPYLNNIIGFSGSSIFVAGDGGFIQFDGNSWKEYGVNGLEVNNCHNLLGFSEQYLFAICDKNNSISVIVRYGQ